MRGLNRVPMGRVVAILFLAAIFLPASLIICWPAAPDPAAPDPVTTAPQEKDTPRRVRPDDGKASPGKPEAKAPDEDKLYVWQQPQTGPQSVLVLHVLPPVKGEDGKMIQQAEVAMLVPVRVRLDVKPGWKPDALDKRLVGRMVTAELKGREASGMLQVDLWLGKEAGGWLSGLKP